MTLEARLNDLIAPVVSAAGYELVRVSVTGGKTRTLQVMAERPDKTMTAEDCARLSRALSPALEEADPIEGNYNLEVSSPGIDRPLVRRSDFETWTGHVAKLETQQMINGRKRYKGMILGVAGEDVTFRREAPAKDEDAEFTIPLAGIKEARLVLTDELIAEALKRDKALRAANGIEEDGEISPDN